MKRSKFTQEQAIGLLKELLHNELRSHRDGFLAVCLTPSPSATLLVLQVAL